MGLVGKQTATVGMAPGSCSAGCSTGTVLGSGFGCSAGGQMATWLSPGAQPAPRGTGQRAGHGDSSMGHGQRLCCVLSSLFSGTGR